LGITLLIVTVKEVHMKALLLKASRADADVKETTLRFALVELLPHGEAFGFAEQMGVTPQYLSDIRKGKRRISDEFLERLVRVRKGKAK